MADGDGRAPRKPASKRARYSTVIGAVIGLAGVVFVVRAIAKQWDTIRSSLSDARPAWLVAGVLCAAVAMVLMAIPWRTALSLLGARLPQRLTLRYYFAGEIGKYVPGGIWPIVGRGELARSGGVTMATAYASVALSLGALYLAAMIFVIILLPFWVASSGGNLDVLWVLALLPIGLAFLHPRPLTWLIGRAERILRRDIRVDVPPWSKSVVLVARYIPCWLFVGTATWAVARAFDSDVGWLQIVPAAVLSWIIGFVLVPIPGGLGVREAAFVGLAGGLSSGIAATVAIAARLSFMLVDGVAALLAGMALRRGSRRQKRASEKSAADTTPADAGAV
jgi:uncharacterized membrane protein YbhN (UPF0104 family)